MSKSKGVRGYVSSSSFSKLNKMRFPRVHRNMDIAHTSITVGFSDFHGVPYIHLENKTGKKGKCSMRLDEARRVKYYWREILETGTDVERMLEEYTGKPVQYEERVRRRNVLLKSRELGDSSGDEDDDDVVFVGAGSSARTSKDRKKKPLKGKGGGTEYFDSDEEEEEEDESIAVPPKKRTRTEQKKRRPKKPPVERMVISSSEEEEEEFSKPLAPAVVTTKKRLSTPKRKEEDKQEVGEELQISKC